MKILKQLIKEFYVPFLVAIVWTGINALKLTKKPSSWTDYVNIGMPTFFFASWMTGQFFRVKKQESVSSSLSNIEARVEAVLGDISKQANDMKIISDRQLYQAFDVCLSNLRDAREELADLTRQFIKTKAFDVEKFSYKRDNPLYRCKVALNTLISYAMYTHNFEINDELRRRYNRTATFTEEVAGTVTNFLKQLSRFSQKWQTDKSREIIKEIHNNLEQVKNNIVKDTIYDTKLYKNNNLKLVLNRHLNSLDKLMT
ncbi:hypothetical protein [Pedobacter xixiisoli]|uniref:Uncharacterized protein n=1 Tax=Pedobacter xixiisoli TaxID=1476464 RepID=A0A285ZZP6_9SPHI|nr:hypothetical protein [Pedobacter xixiisoli]SOD15139.1 hypothetical protein SAMN06297358_2114 [Pedobacter xixiisoli]